MVRLFSLVVILLGAFFGLSAFYGAPSVAPQEQAAVAEKVDPAPAPAPVAAIRVASQSAPLPASVERLTGSAASGPQILEHVAPSEAMVQLAAAGEVRAALSDAALPGHYAQVTATSANVRGGPSTRDPVVGRLMRGDEVSVIGDHGNGWLLIRIEGDGMEGWISARLLSQ